MESSLLDNITFRWSTIAFYWNMFIKVLMIRIYLLNNYIFLKITTIRSLIKCKFHADVMNNDPSSIMARRSKGLSRIICEKRIYRFCQFSCYPLDSCSKKLLITSRLTEKKFKPRSLSKSSWLSSLFRETLFLFSLSFWLNIARSQLISSNKRRTCKIPFFKSKSPLIESTLILLLIYFIELLHFYSKQSI